jgi:mycothiol synthase
MSDMTKDRGRSKFGKRPLVIPKAVKRLTPAQRSKVVALVRSAADLDGVAPLSEQALLAVRNEPHAGAGSDTTGTLHLLAYAGSRLQGYAHLDRGASDKATAELVVHPSYRRRGVATALVHALEGAVSTVIVPAQTLQVWSHGDLDEAHDVARRGGYQIVRELWQMRRSLRPDSMALPEVSLPEGFSARHFVVGQDEEAWLRLNARAFVNHPEQGRMTRSDLDRRMAEPWFDPQGLILIENTSGPETRLAASHWTKVVLPDDETLRPTEGEVYVVAVDPEYQGLGLGRSVTVLGLVHLQDRGLVDAMLYVDADNLAAVTTYTRLDFVRSAVDIMYSLTVHTAV